MMSQEELDEEAVVVYRADSLEELDASCAALAGAAVEFEVREHQEGAFHPTTHWYFLVRASDEDRACRALASLPADATIDDGFLDAPRSLSAARAMDKGHVDARPASLAAPKFESPVSWRTLVAVVALALLVWGLLGG